MHLKNVLNWKKKWQLYPSPIFKVIASRFFLLTFIPSFIKSEIDISSKNILKLKKKLQLHLINSFIGNDFVSQVKILPVG